MIQSYLKTGMVFYDDRDKQHFRRDCCKSDFCQMTDKDHFPSFQVYANVPLDGNTLDMEVFDTDDNDMGLVVMPMTLYNMGDFEIQITHDFRDVLIGAGYPALVDNEGTYYIRIRAGTNSEYHYWYSEAFKVCDCDMIGVGDGINLIENGWFDGWNLAVNPGNFPDDWTVAANDAANYVDNRPPAGGGDWCQMISDGVASLRIAQTILEIGKWYVATINITAVASGSVDLKNNGAVLVAWGTTGQKNFVFQAITTTIRFQRSFGIATNITFTDVRVEEFVGFGFCDRMTLTWWSDCDWDRIIYQDGFRNSLVLSDPEKIELQLPAEDIEVSPNERLGELFPNDVIIKKRYRFKIRIPEYLWNALIRLPAYGSEMPNFHCWIIMPIYHIGIAIIEPAPRFDADVAQTAPMSEVIIKGEWDTGNCFNTFEVEFVDDDEYPVVATNCCDDGDYSEV